MKSLKKPLFLLILLLCCPAFLMAQAPVRPPRGLKSTAFQREAELTWYATTLTDIEWEILLDGREPIRSKHNGCTIDGLEPATTYTARVRMVRGAETSTAVEETFTTQSLQRSLTDENRIPYLRTVRINGRCPKVLPLYFNELGSATASISYRLNGEEVVPKSDNTLLIDTPHYQDRLEIKIDEGGGRTFHLTYFLSVMD